MAHQIIIEELKRIILIQAQDIAKIPLLKARIDILAMLREALKLKTSNFIDLINLCKPCYCPEENLYCYGS